MGNGIRKAEKIGYHVAMATVATKQKILRRIQMHGQEIRSLGVERIGLFGSFAREEQNSRSDVDFLVRFRPQEKTFDNFMELGFFLEGLLQRKVELVTPESLSPYLGPHILEEVQDVALDKIPELRERIETLVEAED